MTYHGGALLPHVEAQAVYLGSEWNLTPGRAKSQAIDGFLSSFVNGSYMDALTNAGYGVGRGTASTGAVVSANLNRNYYLTDSQIQGYLQSGIRSGTLQAPDANRLYVVYVEPGIAVLDDSDGSDSITGFLGYHGAFAGRDASGRAVDVHYAVMPYPGGWNPTARSQGFPTNFTQLTAVTSHELAEAVTDPNVNYKQLGWYDDRYGSEIGDLTSYSIRQLNGYYVQLLITKNDQVLNVAGATVPSGSAPTGGTGGNGFDAIARGTASHSGHYFAPTHRDPFDINWAVYIG